MKRRVGAFCAVATAALTLSACASSGGAAGSGGGAIKLMVIESLTGTTGVDQTAPDGAKAAAAAINASGGIGGRKLQIVACDSASDPNKSAECARSAISTGVAAVVGTFDPIGISASLPVLAKAGIPYLAPLAVTPTEFSASDSFPIGGGAPTGQFSMVALAKDAHCKTVGTLGDPASDQGQVKALVSQVDKAGMTGYFINNPRDTADFTPLVAQLLQRKPDCVMFAVNGQAAVKIFAGIRRAGSTAQLISSTGSLLPPFLKALGKDANGLLATGDFQNLDAPALQPFRDDMKKYQPSVHANSFTLNAWYGVRAFQQAAKGVKSIDAKTMLAALGKTNALTLPGLPTIDFTKTRSSKLYPRLFKPSVRYYKVLNGAYVPLDNTWHDASTAIP